ncbi:MAG: tetratricopeptide repeat protein, partial [Methyloligellaceae bacterium]
MRGLALALLLVAAALGPAKADSVKACSEATANRNWGVAAVECRRAADHGHAFPQTMLGTMYYNGLGVPEDFLEAAKWYRKAADQGFVLAQVLLGEMHTYGDGIPKDHRAA